MQVCKNLMPACCQTWTSLHSYAEGKEPVSLEKKTYDNTKEKLGQSKQQETAPAAAQPAFA